MAYLILAICFLVFFIMDFLISRIGWFYLYKYLEKFPKKEFKGQRIGLTSLSIDDVSYRSCVVVFANEEGVLLKPFFFLRLGGHSTLFIPWTEFKEAYKNSSLTRIRKYNLGDRSQFTICLEEKTCALIEQKVGNVFSKL